MNDIDYSLHPSRLQATFNDYLQSYALSIDIIKIMCIKWSGNEFSCQQKSGFDRSILELAT